MIVIVGNDHKTGESNNGDNYKELEKNCQKCIS